MNEIVESKNLTPAQLELLKLFRIPMSDKHFNELKNTLLNFLDERIFEEVEKACIEKNITTEDIENLVS
jgi:hypothetical protein